MFVPDSLSRLMYGCYYHLNNLRVNKSQHDSCCAFETCNDLFVSSDMLKCRLSNLLSDHPVKDFRIAAPGAEQVQKLLSVGPWGYMFSKTARDLTTTSTDENFGRHFGLLFCSLGVRAICSVGSACKVLRSCFGLFRIVRFSMG